jgi:hypothetical protein
LIVEGEELLGAKQNRIVNATFLVAGKTEIVIPVSCVEQRRWRYDSESFASAAVTPSKNYSTSSSKVMLWMHWNGMTLEKKNPCRRKRPAASSNRPPTARVKASLPSHGMNC